MKICIALALFISTSLTISSCKKENIKEYDCTGITPTYNGEIKTILDTHCAFSGCHNASSKKAGINLSDYSNAKTESAKDRFLGSVQHIKGYDDMPKNASKLDEVTIRKLYCWVKNGSPQN
jgi:hypothetical protein